MKNGNGRIKRLIAGGLVGLVGLTFAPSTAGAAISTQAFCANVPTGQSGFTDIAQAGVHQRNVECLRGSGITQGVTATTYAPQANTSRAQMATFIANMVDFATANDAPGGATVPALPTAAASQDRFTDDETSVHENNINRLAQAGIVQGTGGTNFSPSDPVSRAQMASFVANAIRFIRGAVLPEGADAFTDDETSVHEANINRLANADIVDGTGSGGSKAVFSVSLLVSRAQMASFIIQGLAFLHAEGLIRPIPAPAAGSDDVEATAAPELEGCSITAPQSPTNPNNGIVTFDFDEDVSGQAANVARIHIYRFNGTSFNAVVASTSGDKLLAEFPANQLVNATTCTVDFGAIADVSGQQNPEGDEPIQNVVQAAGVTEGPDLVSVGNFRTNVSGQVLVDYVFDEAAQITAPATGDPTEFELIMADGTVFQGAAIAAGAGTTTITVQFTQNNTQIPFSQIARGVVDAGEVRDTAPAPGPFLNPLQAAEVLSGGTTVEPDLVAVRPVQGQATQFEFEFDQPVSAQLTAPAGCTPVGATGTPADAGGGVANPCNLNPAQFIIYDANGLEENATAATRSQANGGVVIVTFGTAGGVDPTQAVGGSVETFAVRSTQNENQAGLAGFSERDETPIQQVTFTAGLTALPDLTGVRVIVDPVTQNRVVRYTFDQSIGGLVDAATPANNFSGPEFRLYDANNAQFTSTCATGGAVGAPGSGACLRTVSGDANSIDVTGFTNAQVNAAVIGTVNDTQTDAAAQGGAVVRFPEGDEGVVRS